MERWYTLGTIAVIAALIGTAALFVLVLPERRRRSLPPALRMVADFLNMRSLLLEGILKAVYVFLNLLMILAGIIAMFTVENGFAVGIVMIIAGPFVLRVFHETLMLRLVTLKTLQEIRSMMAGRGAGSAAPEEEQPPVRRERSGRRGRSLREAESFQGMQQQGSNPEAQVWTVQTPPQGFPGSDPRNDPRSYPRNYAPDPSRTPGYPAYGAYPGPSYGNGGVQQPAGGQPYPGQGKR